MSVDNTQDITVLSLCAGYGGLEIGLARALQRLLRVVAVEVEAYALANLVAKAEEGKLGIEALWPDLRTFPAERFRECFDIITAGYPCQGESCAGKRLGKADPRWLWPYIERIIKAVRPVWFFGENVPGHLTLGFPTVYRSLRNLGYTVEAGLFSAAECGAPHKRERLFILAYNHGRGRKTIPILQKRQPTTPYPCRKMADTERSKQGQGVRQEPQAGIGGDRFTIQRWPARPGQPQYEWEEPRVVADTGKKQTGRLSQPKERQQNRKAGSASGQGQAQSRLGRAADGTAGRVDRLRLLGNGVVPQQAEKAFRYLMQKANQ